MTLSRLEAAREILHPTHIHTQLYLNESDEYLCWAEGKIWHHFRSWQNQEEWEERPIDAKTLLSLLRQYFQRFPRVYLNAYAVSRCYGGPEEGGWWYDDREPLASLPVLKKGDNLERATKMLQESLYPNIQP